MNEKNLQLDILSLAQEQSFISWVKNGTNSSEWEQWISTYPDQMEKVEEARLLVQALQFNESPVRIDKADLWSRIESSTDAKEVTLQQSTDNVRKLWRRSFIGIAASVAVLLAAVFLMSDNMEIITPFGENMVYTLPDNSKVSINAGTELSFDKNRWEANRKVNLNGEAFFEVEKGSKFTVVTNNGNVQVLGTKFNVYSRGDSFKVKCTEGRVEVTSANSREVLNAGDVVELSDQTLEKIPFQAKIDWRQKSYSYRQAQLGEVFDEIERQFDVDIIVDDSVRGMSFTGPLETKDINKALYMVTWPMSLDFNVNGKTIEIVSK